jgi:hypothetical protein
MRRSTILNLPLQLVFPGKGRQGQARAGEGRRGQARAGEGRQGQARAGKGRQGQVRGVIIEIIE